MERILSPSILSADFSNLSAALSDIKRGGARYVHLDVMDGIFVPNISFGIPVIKSIRKASDLIFDAHLMIHEPIRYIKDFKDAGCDIITVHLEAAGDIKKTLLEIKNSGLKAGLSIKPGTDTDEVKEFLPIVDMILLMSVEPGFGGQKFIKESLERARRLRKIIDDSPYNTDLEIDGGITLDNAAEVIDAGCNILVAGSAVFKAPYENTAAFMEILNADSKSFFAV